MSLPPVTPGMTVVFGLVLVALVLFATEPVPVDVTALGVMVALLLTEPLTQLLADAGILADPILVLRTATETPAAAVEAGLSGFSSVATITVLAMFILSEGVWRTGVVSLLGARVAALTGDDEGRQLGATIGIVGPLSGFINNTAAVAILLPMVSDLAHAGRTSPSKLLMPLSFASMFGGTLTVIGTSTNILASDLTARLLPARGPIGMFEFTALGLVLLVVGSAYLLTVGRRLVPARIPPEEDLTEEFQMGDYLTEVVVREDSPLIGQTVAGAIADSGFDVEVVQLVRGETVFAVAGPKQVRAGDIFALRTDRETLVELMDVEGLDLRSDVPVTEAELEAAEGGQNLVEVVVAPGSDLVGNTLAEAEFRQRYDASVLAFRRGQEVIRKRLDQVTLRVGDTLLVQGPAASIERIEERPHLIVAQEIHRPDVRESKMAVSVAIVAAVVLSAAVTPVSIATAALAGAVGMVLTGCLRPPEVYEAVQWDVIFLLAGVIPLGIALERTGGADLLAEAVVAASPGLPAVVVLGLMYVVTALLTNVVSNNASVVLMIPVAVQAATAIGANAFSFVLAVTFAASTAFMTPVGYQTNLFVYGPGGYRFTDYLRVGAPLQALFAVVTTVGIAVIWGV